MQFLLRLSGPSTGCKAAPRVGAARCSTSRAGQRGYTLIDLLLVVALVGVISAITVPMTGSMVAAERFRGDSQAIANLVGLAKMRASANFTRARVRVDLDANMFMLERWDKPTNRWVVEGGATQTAQGVRFGFGTLATPPPNTQTAIGFSPECRTGLTAATAMLPNTACIIFNSRGLPVDADGALSGGHAIYVTDGGRVAATTVTATPRIRRWSTPATTARWREEQ
jgi:prepilin-type N-terminal cleavage/methylation domain-containing protein